LTGSIHAFAWGWVLVLVPVLLCACVCVCVCNGHGWPGVSFCRAVYVYDDDRAYLCIPFHPTTRAKLGELCSGCGGVIARWLSLSIPNRQAHTCVQAGRQTDRQTLSQPVDATASTPTHRNKVSPPTFHQCLCVGKESSHWYVHSLHPPPCAHLCRRPETKAPTLFMG